MDSDVIAFADGPQTDSAFTRYIVNVDAAYLPLDVWQEIHAGACKGEEISP